MLPSMKWTVIGGTVAAVGYFLYISKKKEQEAGDECSYCVRLLSQSPHFLGVDWPVPSRVVKDIPKPCRACAEQAVAQAHVIARQLYRKLSELQSIRSPNASCQAKIEAVKDEIAGLPGNIALIAHRAGLAKPEIKIG